MRIPVKATLRLGFAALCAMTAVAGQARPPAAWNAMARSFDSTLEQGQIVGGSVALVEHGRIVARHDYGFADLANHKPVTADTIFHWASITKTLNAISVMQLRDRGRLSLDDRITQYVPELREVHNRFGSMDDITLRMLMTHSAGFQSATWPYKQGTDWEPFEPATWQQLVAMLPYQEITFKPGSEFNYSNPAWIYVARALEKLTGDPWENYIQKNIFSPLGMSRSYFGLTPYYLQAQRSQRYIVRDGPDGKPVTTAYSGEFDPGITIPNGGWNAPLADVASYVAFLTAAAGGNAEMQRRFDAVLSRASLQEMWQPQMATTFSSAYGVQYVGLAFFLTSIGDQHIVGHTGHQGGFSTMLYINPASGRGVVAAFNTDNSTAAAEQHNAFLAIREQAFKVLTESQ